MLSRKEVLKILSTLPLGGLAASGLASNGFSGGLSNPVLTGGRGSSKPGALEVGPEIFRSIGVEPVINCRGTFTIIGGSIEHSFVKEAMSAASNNFIQYDELAEGIGARLAELTGAEWGMVSSGCAAALKHVTAACVAGGNPEKLIQIPYLNGLDKTQVIMPRNSRTIYDHAIRNIGVELITVDSEEELVSAMGPKTALICLMSGRTGPLGLKNVAGLAKPKGIPVLVDAAAEDLTIPNVHLRDGATIVAYSGGKAILGPQCAGLILGDKNILMSAWQASSPHHGPGRDNKVGREEMMGMLAAVEAWVKRDHEGEWQRWLTWLDHIAGKASQIEGVSTQVVEPEGLGNRTPWLNITWDPEKLHVTGAEVAEELGRTKPRIALGSRDNRPEGTTSIHITSGQMQPGDDQVVADRIYDVLSRTRRPKPAMAAPGFDLSGRWLVNVQFFSSESEHTFFIEKQDSNWIQGAHKGDYHMRDLAGTIEGNEVKLVSSYRRPANRLHYIFSGTLSGDTVTGEMHMGEYLNASFTAKRHRYPDSRQTIMVPQGPPLAN